MVRKDLAFLVKGNLPVPTFVLEYLLGQYCATDDQEAIEKGLDKVKKVISDNYVRREEAEEIKSRIREAGTYRIIDKVSCILNDRADHYEATFANLGLAGIAIADEIVVQNPKLLSGNGVWSIVNITYNTGSDAPSRWEIQTLKPIQISRVDVNDYVSKRQRFSSEEWMDFLVHTVGLNPEVLNEREKMIVLARLLPFVENNFNFMELGPKGTGKSHVFQELSPYGVLVSGGDVTSARLFSRISGSREYLGLVAYWDVVAWDEYEHQKGKKIDPVMIDTMQNYLANKSFNRGKATHEASASMVFVGNTKHTVDFMLRNSHLFESIPDQFIKGAFLDRIHCYNPGWEVKILKKNSFSKDYGLITDYIAAVLHELRSRDFSPMLDEYVKFDGSLSERDSLAIRKTFSGFVKLLYPDGNLTHEEAMKIVDFAGEGGKLISDWINYKTEKFLDVSPKDFYFDINTEFVLLNTIYLKSQWAQKGLFDKKNNYDSKFYGDKNENNVTFMKGKVEKSHFYKKDAYRIASLDYKRGIKLNILLPNEDANYSEVLGNEIALKELLNFEKLNEYEQKDIEWSLPIFKIKQDYDLTSVLTNLGLTKATFETPDLSSMTKAANLYISSSTHKAGMEINNDGVKAAAYTGITVSTKSAPSKAEYFNVNHPFGYSITNSNGYPLFMGVINNL